MTITVGRQADIDDERLANAKPNSIAVMRKDLFELWDWKKNDELGLDPYTTTCGMNKLAYWKCPNQPHTFAMKVDTRVRSPYACPYCSGRRVLTGFNDLATTHKDISKEWLYAVDRDCTPETVTAGSHAMVHWKCSKHGIEWNARVYDRASGSGCRLCRSEKISVARSRVKPGNSLAEKFPDVASEWDYDLNEKTPWQVSAHARETAHWICSKHDAPYRWMAAIYTRTGKLPSGCPKCGVELSAKANMTPKKGQSLADLYPDALKEWAFDLNNSESPFNVKPRSNRRFVWRCFFCGDTWSTTPLNRTLNGKFAVGCRKCKNSSMNPNRLHPRTRGYLIDERPDIAAEWDHAKNKEELGLSLEQISATSNLNVWWLCPNGHRYQTSVNHRVLRGDGCNYCAIRTHVSYPEKAIYYYVGQVFDDAEENARPDGANLGKLNLDIWIPSIDTAIEYDGHFWHQDAERDLKKDLLCADAHIRIIRVREHGCVTYESTALMIERETVYDRWSLDKAINELLGALGHDGDVDVDTARDEVEIRKLISEPNGVVPFADVPVGGQLQLNLAC